MALIHLTTRVMLPYSNYFDRTGGDLQYLQLTSDSMAYGFENAPITQVVAIFTLIFSVFCGSLHEDG